LKTPLTWAVVSALLSSSLLGCSDREAGPNPDPPGDEPVGGIAQGAGIVSGALLELDAIELGDSPEEVEAAWGAPLETESLVGELGHELTWTYEGRTVEFIDSAAAYITCTDGHCVAGKLIERGMTRREVEVHLGTPVQRPDLPDSIAQYFGAETDCGVSLTFSNGVLSEILLWCDYS
jgi:hypothetical protein